MKNAVRKKLNESLSNLALDVQEAIGSFVFWGEVELPECIRKELEEKQQQE
jgi:hypothetical protein